MNCYQFYFLKIMQTLSELLELPRKLHLFLTLTFLGMHDNRWLLESIY